MTTVLTPRESAQRALDLLAARLEPIIARTLAPHLPGDLHWVDLLEELDRIKGKEPKYYDRHDIQPQLRIITERLGNLEYPFDDYRREVSTLGNELRISRNRIAHMDELDDVAAWRIADFTHRLLARLGDAEGAEEAQAWRDGILRLISPEESQLVPPVTETMIEELENEQETTDPDPEVYDLPSSATPANESGIRHERQMFDPWVAVPVGTSQVLDSLKTSASREILRSVMEEIVEHEGPIHVDRLARLTARSFGLGRVEAARMRAVKNQIKQCSGMYQQGDWVWPATIDAASWTEFRPNSSRQDRPFRHIPPQEIRNASTFLRNAHPDDSAAEHESRVLQTFGRKRKTKQVREHLAGVALL